MDKTILQYQKAFNTMVDKFKNNSSVLAVMVFGSMVTGDLWNESDIDLFVIIDGKPFGIKNIYTEDKGIPIHIKLMNKGTFCQLSEEDLRGGFIHRIFASSRLVFSKDLDITEKYDSGRFFRDIDRERWNMVYLGKVLKDVSVCKKYLHNDGIYRAYTSAVNCLEQYAKLKVNSSGYMVSKDVMTMASNFDEQFKDCMDKLFFNKDDISKNIEEAINYIEESIDRDLRSINNLLLNYMREKDCFLSAEDIKNDPLFSSYDLNIEEILNKLNETNIIKKHEREYKTEDGISIVSEKVYYI